MLPIVLVALAAASAAAGSADEFLSEPLVLMEPTTKRVGGVNWGRLRRVEESDEMKLHFFLKHPEDQLKNFEDLLLDISNPKSPNYGNWLSASDVQELLKAPEDGVRAVYDFLDAFGATKVTTNRETDILRTVMPAKAVEQMLSTELYVFAYRDYPELQVIRAGTPYHLPTSVATHVSFVGDLLLLPRIEPKKPIELSRVTEDDAQDEFSSCGMRGTVTPDVLFKQYRIPDLKDEEVAEGSSMAVAEFQLQYFDEADLMAFGDSCNTPPTDVEEIVGANHEVVCKLGGTLCVEALLDIEYIGAMADPIPLSVYYSRTYSLLDWIEEVLGGDDPALVHSVSYGNDEAQQVSVEYMKSVDTEFMKAGSMGISVLFASGDQGVWGREGYGKEFHPDFPAGSPYVTAVGGTDFVEKSTFGEEKAWASGGGGFSDTFATPSWQAEAVKAYLSSGVELPDSSYYNAEGRGYPDLSALAGTQNPYYVTYGGGRSAGGVGGTSAACPVVAAVFAQLNNLRIQAGKPPLGFLNPFIYENADAFFDVTKGENNNNVGTGFKASNGWDPATGFGTPNYDKLAALM